MFFSAPYAHNSTPPDAQTANRISQKPQQFSQFRNALHRWHVGCIKPFVRIRFGVISLLAFFCLQAQAAPHPSTNEFPFEYREGMIWLKVSAPNSSEPLNFLLDSGAAVSVVNLETTRKLNITLGHRVSVAGVGSKTTGYWPQRLSLKLDSLPLAGDYLAVDLDCLSDACHCEVDGLLGADFFRDRIVQIDFAASKLRILSQHTPDPASESLPLKNHRGALLVPLTVNSARPRWFRLDTGCASALALVQAHAAKAATRTRTAVALSDVPVATGAANVKLGSKIFDHVPTDIHSDEIFRGESGLLGNGLLSRFQTVTIDTKVGRITLADPYQPSP